MPKCFSFACVAVLAQGAFHDAAAVFHRLGAQNVKVRQVRVSFSTAMKPNVLTSQP